METFQSCENDYSQFFGPVLTTAHLNRTITSTYLVLSIGLPVDCCCWFPRKRLLFPLALLNPRPCLPPPPLVLYLPFHCLVQPPFFLLPSSKFNEVHLTPSPPHPPLLPGRYRPPPPLSNYHQRHRPSSVFEVVSILDICAVN